MTATGRWAVAFTACLGLACGFSPPARAQESAYRIGEGDVLEISVWKKPELTRRTIVRPDGMITLPLVQDVRAAGMTVAELRKNLSDAFNTYVTSPDVSITVEEARSYRAFVLGAVTTNGSFDMLRPITASQLLAQAGGPTAEADLSGAYISRGGQRMPVRLSLGSGGGKSDQDPVVMPADTLTVPYLQPYRNRILVAGEVATPKAIPFKEGMTIMDVLLESGGGTPYADLSAIRISRAGAPGGEGLRIDLGAVLQGKQGENVPLQSGDTVIVPAREGYAHRVLVLGQVRTPRSMPFREGMTVLDAYAEAGGGTEWADEGSVKVVRRKGGATEELPVNVKRIMNDGNLSLNIPLAPGDIVFVPR